MYLSQLYFDLRGERARLELADPYEMHSSLVRAFVSDSGQVPPRFIWRQEPFRLGQVPEVIIQSAWPPDFSELERVPAYLCREHEYESRSKYVGLDKLVEEGASYRFRLVANPTVSREGARIGLVGELDQVAWLRRQGERHGFGVESAVVVTSDYIKSHKRKTGALISLRRVHYEGILCVNDAECLRAALLAGIGPGKALGCGLLSIVRILRA